MNDLNPTTEAQPKTTELVPAGNGGAYQIRFIEEKRFQTETDIEKLRRLAAANYKDADLFLTFVKDNSPQALKLSPTSFIRFQKAENLGTPFLDLPADQITLSQGDISRVTGLSRTELSILGRAQEWPGAQLTDRRRWKVPLKFIAKQFGVEADRLLSRLKEMHAQALNAIR